QGTPGATGTTADTESGGEGSGGLAVKQGRATLPSGGYTIDGSVVSTPFGPVEVRLTAGGTRIADVHVLEVPNDRGHSTQINNYATPLLRQEVLRAQSADVDVVSGATYTSFAYAQSLQAALDNAAKR
ncbi:MAG TPA: FMN-binding protein, partial [Micromonosporaceae bacterium]